MPTLTIRKLDEETVTSLRVRAAKRGVSLEEEVRQILRESAVAPERLGDLALQLFQPAAEGEAFEAPRRQTSESELLSE